MLFHNDPAAGHQGVTRTLKRIAKDYFWPQIQQDIKRYIYRCDLCQKLKARHHLPYGELVPLPIPTAPQQEITIDIITDLLPYKKGNKVYNTILVMVDRLTKVSIYLLTTKKLISNSLILLYLEYIYLQFRLLSGIISNRGTIFTSRFWRTFYYLLTCRRLLSVAYYLQIDG